MGLKVKFVEGFMSNSIPTGRLMKAVEMGEFATTRAMVGRVPRWQSHVGGAAVKIECEPCGPHFAASACCDRAIKSGRFTPARRFASLPNLRQECA